VGWINELGDVLQVVLNNVQQPHAKIIMSMCVHVCTPTVAKYTELKVGTLT